MSRAARALAALSRAALSRAALSHAALLASAVGLAVGLALADTAPLARVGSIAIEVAEFRQRAALVPELDWRELGAAWPEQRRRFLDQVLIPEALLTLAAERLPDELPPARDRVLARTLGAALADEAARAVPSDADLRAYRARHEAEFGTPRSLGIWRILLSTESEARAVISQLAPPTPEAFSRIARERSLDRATNMRAGNLGFVAADGQTAVPELRVSPALFAAAERVDDGALVPEPVPEGDAFAVVWRRTSGAATALPAAEVSATIASRLAEQRAAAAQDALLEHLRREQLSEYHPARVSDYEPRFPEARSRAPRSLVVPEPNRAPHLLPEPTDRGLR